MGWGQAMTQKQTDQLAMERIESLEANVARILVLEQRIARLLDALLEKHPDETRITRERMALRDLLAERNGH